MLQSFRLQRLFVLLLFALLASACGSTSGDAASVAETVEVETAEVETAEVETVETDEVEEAEEPAFEGSGASDGDLTLLTAGEIDAVLAGNTIVGNWVGEEYRQFFAGDGTTTYSPVNGGRDTVGEWRVNNDTGLYESLWGSATVWDEYEVHQDGDEFFWTGQGVQLSLFTVVSGNQLAGG